MRRKVPHEFEIDQQPSARQANRWHEGGRRCQAQSNGTTSEQDTHARTTAPRPPQAVDEWVRAWSTWDHEHGDSTGPRAATTDARWTNMSSVRWQRRAARIATAMRETAREALGPVRMHGHCVRSCSSCFLCSHLLLARPLSVAAVAVGVCVGARSPSLC
jgi:hypothetical protein